MGAETGSETVKDSPEPSGHWGSFQTTKLSQHQRHLWYKLEDEHGRNIAVPQTSLFLGMRLGGTPETTTVLTSHLSLFMPVGGKECTSPPRVGKGGGFNVEDTS